jgi:hypothetical protein
MTVLDLPSAFSPVCPPAIFSFYQSGGVRSFAGVLPAPPLAVQRVRARLLGDRRDVVERFEPLPVIGG